MDESAKMQKITVGYVVQEFCPKTRQYVGQEFIAGDEVSYENESGEFVDGWDEYLPFDMVQPQ